MKTYRKTATVQAKIFESGDEDGFSRSNFIADAFPYVTTLENEKHHGVFGSYYLCVGIDGERWLVEKSIFERTYELIESE